MCPEEDGGCGGGGGGDEGAAAAAVAAASEGTSAASAPASVLLRELRSWWEVPAIAHFCSLFRTAFRLPDFEIENLKNIDSNGIRWRNLEQGWGIQYPKRPSQNLWFMLQEPKQLRPM
uniref:Uncharacterized protein n=1 Tax=Sphaerodactylus townsendi TaxID=933632 RepID=A0ACB8FMU3_9SAUR